MIEQDRYFIVMYNFLTHNGTIGSGYMTITTIDYPPNKETQETILERNPNMMSIVFTNIIELSKADYESWNRQ